MRSLADRLLTAAHYLVVQASSVEEARSLWDQHRPEVALVDLSLAGEPGSTLLKEKWVRDIDTVVVVLTGSDDLDLADEAFEQGAYGYLVKPFTTNELLMQVSSALRRRRLERAVFDNAQEREINHVER